MQKLKPSKMATRLSALPFNTLSIAKRTLLTFGYTNDIERNHELSNAIPSEINEIIVSYNRYSDTWDDKYLNEDTIELTENKIMSLKHDYTTTSMYGNVSLSSGSYTWKLRMVKRPIKCHSQHPFIGFIRDDPEILDRFKSSNDWDRNDGYMYCCGDGSVGHSDSWAMYEVETFRNENDILDITLDLDAQKIYLSINGQPAAVPDPFQNITKDKYRLVVTICSAKGTVIELL